MALASDASPSRRLAELAAQAPEVVAEERAWLAGAIRQALAETDDGSPWAVLFLALAHTLVLVRKVEHRLHPRRDIAMPSPFVYAMQ